MYYLSGELIPLSIGKFLGSSAFYSLIENETLGMYNNWTSNITGVLGATLGLPAATRSPFGNASCHINNDLVISAELTDIHIL
jgi:hypothetical protein